ncbi:type I restriction enzyme, S subunit [Allopseudospirillum japonicum]|uniref:Type I restriction enzyme, S subunit n=1 Tax=Allopseudospirillum japonicum TaxID=64971 RepID=A0A1H6QLD8_9GAMM|nr:restriction endonuclease subunit S [Allopseudospirillum japonicum]SEI44393.1 type I restriction enzyme, S subunit [Allopseudospirillum japonicum]
MVPNGWEKRDLQGLINVKHGFAFKSEFFTDCGDYILLTPGSFNESGGFRDQGGKTKYYVGDVPDGYLLKKGDMLLAMTEQAEGLLGSALFVPENHKYLHNQRLGLVQITAPEQIAIEFLYLFFNAPSTRKQITEQSTGTKVKHTSPDRLCSVIGLIPPLPEQKKIAQILSTWDKAITTTQHLLANSQQQKKALMQQLLTGKKRLLDQNGKRFSGEWIHGYLSDLGKITKGKALSSKDLIDGDYPVIAGGKSSPYNHKKFTHENVITVSASGAYAGYVAYHPYKLWASDCSVVTSKANSDIRFIYQLMSHMQLKIYSLQSGGAQPHVYPKDLEVLRVNIPPLEEQQKIAAVLSTADQEITTLQQKLEAFKQEKQALMQQLLTGKRRVKVA